jgi:hypothetical protein
LVQLGRYRDHANGSGGLNTADYRQDVLCKAVGLRLLGAPAELPGQGNVVGLPNTAPCNLLADKAARVRSEINLRSLSAKAA